MSMILLVEDDKQYANNLKTALESKGHKVTYFSSPVEAVAEFVNSHFDLVVSDYLMDEMNGIRMISILKGINPGIRTIMLTAFPEEDIEDSALDISIDYYLSKDKSLSITTKYVEELLKKRIINDKQTQKLYSHEEGIVVDLQQHEVYKDSNLVVLTKKEYDLLKLFLENKGIALSRKMIAETIWETDIEDIDLRVIDGHIKRLRKKLDIFSLTSIRGYGYKWNE